MRTLERIERTLQLSSDFFSELEAEGSAGFRFDVENVRWYCVTCSTAYRFIQLSDEMKDLEGVQTILDDFQKAIYTPRSSSILTHNKRGWKGVLVNIQAANKRIITWCERAASVEEWRLAYRSERLRFSSERRAQMLINSQTGEIAYETPLGPEVVCTLDEAEILFGEGD